MNKAELVSQVASSGSSTQVTAEKVINAMLQSITASIQKGNDVRLLGFGTFTIKQRPAKAGRNPRTGVAIQIPAKRVVRFRPGKIIEEAVALEPNAVAEPEEKTPKKAVKAKKSLPKRLKS